jgi:ACS family hexuronate transporter-like MFS transporter
VIIGPSALPLQQDELIGSASYVPGVTMEAPAPLSRARWMVLSLLFIVTVINFIDRQTLSVLAPVIRTLFHLSNQQYGRIVAALQFGMMTGEVPMGYLMDRIGTRIGLSIAVLWWSTATGAQVFARGGVGFGLTRFWMGTGECGGFSGGIKTLTRIFPKKERTLAIGIFNSGSVLGAAVAAPLIAYVLRRYGLRAAFLVPTVIGLAWIPLWLFAYRGTACRPAPSSDPPDNEPPATLRSMLSDSSGWAVMGCRFFIGPVMQFYWYWIPNYLYNVRHMSMTEIGIASVLPFLFGDLGGVLGGWLAGRLLSRGMSVARVRKLLMYTSAVLCVASGIVPLCFSRWAALSMIGVAIFADNFLSANMFAAISDLFPEKKVGRATGLTGFAGGLSGLLFPLLTGFFADRGSYTPVFVMLSLMPLAGTVALFLFGRRYRTLNTPTPATA